MKEMKKNIAKKFEKFIIYILIVLMGIVILVTSFELVFYIFREIYRAFYSSHLLLEKKEMLHIFELFFNVLIGVELYETVRLYVKEDIFHAEFVLLVGLIAVSRKVIIIDYTQIDNGKLIGISLLIAVLSGGYYLLKLSQRNNNNDKTK